MRLVRANGNAEGIRGKQEKEIIGARGDRKTIKYIPIQYLLCNIGSSQKALYSFRLLYIIFEQRG